MTDKELEELKETVDNQVNIVANLNGRLRYFEELLKTPGLFQGSTDIHPTDVDAICGTKDPSDPLRSGFVNAMIEFNSSRNS